MRKRISSGTYLRLPIYLTVIYLIATLIIYVLCPYNWPTKMPVLFWTLNVLYIAALAGGYILGQRHRLSLKLIEWNPKTEKILYVTLSVLSIFNFLVYLILVFRSYGLATLDFGKLFAEMGKGLKNPGYGYYMNYMRQQHLDGTDVVGGTVFTVFNLGWSFLKMPIIILSVLYFKKLKIYGKIFTVAYMALVVIYYISIGTNIQFLHVILLVLLPVILELFDLGHAGKLTPKKLIKPIAMVLVCGVLFAGYFGYMIQSRSNTYGYDVDEYQIAGLSPADDPEETEPEETVDSDEKVENQVPAAPKATSKLEKLWISGSSYLTQGYYGMSQALTVDWTPMFGLGNSMFVVNIISGNIHDIDQYTYQMKLEPFGWDSDVRWHSIYTWIANDVSFYGVVVVMLLIGLLFSMMFRDAIVTKNPFARASVFFYILMMLFIPCNNQVGQTADNLLGFLMLVLLWLICKKQTLPQEELNKAPL